jgi:hypothetical protein
MTTQPAPLLTASWADCLLGYIRKSSNDNGGKKADAMLQALADGRTACVRVMSEEQIREWFEDWVRTAGVHGHRIGAVLAFARAMGAIR